MSEPLECPDCDHTLCDEECVCNCDAARAEAEAARLRAERDEALRELNTVKKERDEVKSYFASLDASRDDAWRAHAKVVEERDEAKAQAAMWEDRATSTSKALKMERETPNLDPRVTALIEHLRVRCETAPAQPLPAISLLSFLGGVK